MTVWGLIISAVQPVGQWSQHTFRLWRSPALCLLCLEHWDRSLQPEGVRKVGLAVESLAVCSEKAWSLGTHSHMVAWILVPRTAHTILSRDCFMQRTVAHTSSLVLSPQSIQSYPPLLLIPFCPNISAFIQIRMKVKESPLSPSLTGDYGTALGGVGLNLVLLPGF